MRKFLDDEVPGAKIVMNGERKQEAPPVRNLGLYRTLIAIVSAVATIIIVICVSITSGGSNIEDRTKKVVVLVVDSLHPDMLSFAAASNKAPYFSELVSHGSVYGTLSVPDSIQSQIAAQMAILTGLSPIQTQVNSSADFSQLKSFSSFMKLGRNSDVGTTLIAPSSMFSTGKNTTDGKCNNLGLLDAECHGFSCASNTTDTSKLYCNGLWRFQTCEDSDPETRNEEYIYNHVANAASAGLDLVYVELSNFASGSAKDTSTNNLAAISEMYVTDSLIGRIGSLLAHRSGLTAEDWLFVVTSDGNNLYRKSLYFISEFNHGAPVALKQPTGNTTILDVFPTVVEWLKLSTADAALYGGSILGICSQSGRTVAQGC
eukprot:GILI01017081.1.p1 GENE.GILI01017081.1~~GILI01017081.1.p1  ORF type:complete len:374 (+),score=62.07 GILI01017081.1:136-1257(+)